MRVYLAVIVFVIAAVAMLFLVGNAVYESVILTRFCKGEGFSSFEGIDTGEWTFTKINCCKYELSSQGSYEEICKGHNITDRFVWRALVVLRSDYAN